MLPNVAILSESGSEDKYYDSLTEAVEEARINNIIPSRITILKNITDETEVTISNDKNLVLDMNGQYIETTTGVYAIKNEGKLIIENRNPISSYIKITTPEVHTYGIYNKGELDIIGVSIEAQTGIYNEY